MDTRKWYKTTDKLPEKDEVKVYYFTKSNRLLRGTYHLMPSAYADAHKFRNEVDGLINSDQVTHWMVYDHHYKDVLPLPPDYISHDEIPVAKTKQNVIVSTSLAKEYWYGKQT